MIRELVRLANVPVGATFKYLNVLYLKTRNVSNRGGHKDYEDNCVRLDTQKSLRLHGSYLVEVVNNGN